MIVIMCVSLQKSSSLLTQNTYGDYTKRPFRNVPV